MRDLVMCLYLSLRGVVVSRDGGDDQTTAEGVAESELRAAGLSVMRASHPVPDVRGGVAAAAVLAAVASASEDNASVLVLLSGGASALLPAPAPGLTLEDLRGMTAALLASGCTITEANALRKHMSALAGGRLALAARGAPLLALALSDVVGDRADVIASGPTALPDGSTWADCAATLARYPSLAAGLPPAVTAAVAAADPARETPKCAPPPGVSTRVIAGAGAALRAAASRLQSAYGVPALLLTSSLQGEASEVARALVAAAGDAVSWSWAGSPLLADPVPKATTGPPRPRAALLTGGETTVTLRAHGGNGRGGRNQELALAALIAAADAEAGSPRAASEPLTHGDLSIVCFATDGSDGPTDAAGVCIQSARAAWRACTAAGLDAADALRRHDAYTFFESLDRSMGAADAGTSGKFTHGDDGLLPRMSLAPGGLIRTGSTGTNVGDVSLILCY